MAFFTSVDRSDCCSCFALRRQITKAKINNMTPTGMKTPMDTRVVVERLALCTGFAVSGIEVIVVTPVVLDASGNSDKELLEFGTMPAFRKTSIGTPASAIQLTKKSFI
jgi:hypothetical protein